MSLSDLIKSIFGSKAFGDERVERDWRKIPEMDENKRDDSIFSQFQGGLMKQMEEMFKKFNIAENPPAIQPPVKKIPATDKDDVLKELEPFFHTEKQWEFHLPFKFGGFFGPKWGYDESQFENWKDEDLDGKFEEKDVGKIFEKFRQMPSWKPPVDNPDMFSGHSSVSISSFSGTDGRIEHRKTVKDSSGNERTTVTRSLGNKSHTVTTKTDDKGRQEKVETLKNIDEKDLPTFEKTWMNEELPKSEFVPKLPSTDPFGDKSDQSIFKKIFEMPWK